jgi:hypothetical protein
MAAATAVGAAGGGAACCARVRARAAQRQLWRATFTWSVTEHMSSAENRRSCKLDAHGARARGQKVGCANASVSVCVRARKQRMLIMRGGGDDGET